MGNNLEALRKRAELSQDALAEKMGTKRSQYVKLARGERRLTEDWIKKASRALGVMPSAILDRATIQLVGYVGAGSVLVLSHDTEQNLGDVDSPPMATPSMVAVLVKGDSMRGFAEDGWVLYYDDRREPVTSDLMGELCVVGLPDGRMLVKKLQRGRAPGLFHLYSSNSDPMFDQAIEWAAKVEWIKPR